MAPRTDYKVGDWVKHRYSPQLFEINKIKKINSQFYVRIMSIFITEKGITTGYSKWHVLKKFHKKFEHDKVAQILYKSRK